MSNLDSMFDEVETEQKKSKLDSMFDEVQATPKSPEVSGYKAILPRTYKADIQDGAGIGKQALAAGLDVLSLPGRAIGADIASGKPSNGNPWVNTMGGNYGMSPSQSYGSMGRNSGTDNQTFLQSMADTEGKNLGQQIIRDPALIPGVMTGGAALSGAKALGLTGLKAISAAGGITGAGTAAMHQADNAVQGKAINPLSAAGEIAVGAAFPYAAKGIGLGAKAANKGIGRLASDFSGASEEALRKYGFGFGKGAKELSEAAGTQNEIGGKIVNMLDHIDDHLPEARVIDEIIPNMPDINIENTIAKLEASKKGGVLSSSKSAHERIDQVIKDLREAADANGNISAKKFRSTRIELDGEIGDAFGKESKQYVTALKQARHQMAEDLVSAADASGIPEYSKNMRALAEKYKAADKLNTFLGQSAESRANRQESFVANLYGKNKTKRQEAVKGLQDLFGGDFLNESKNANLAAELGPEGKAGLLQRQFNGRSVLGPVTSGLAGTYVAPGAALVPLALSSPKIAAGILATTGAIDRFINSGVSAMERTGTGSAINKKWVQGLTEKLKTAAPEEIGKYAQAIEKAGVPKEVIQEEITQNFNNLKFGTPTPEAPAQFDPLEAMNPRNRQALPQGQGSLEDMAPAEMERARQEAAQASREAFIRHGRERALDIPGKPFEPEAGPGFRTISRNEGNLPPRKPKGNIPSNFPPPNIESEAIKAVLNKTGRRPLTLDKTRIEMLKDALKNAPTKAQKQEILKLIREENYKIPLKDLQ